MKTLVAALLALTACEDQFVTPTTGDDSGTDAMTPVDGANQEASATDASSTDTSIGVDSAIKTFCQQQSPTPFFCSDWDEGSLTKAYKAGVLGTDWTVQTAMLGSVSLGTTAKSLPGSLTAAVTGTAINPGNAFLAFTDSAAATAITIDFDFYLDSAPSGGPNQALLVTATMAVAVALETTTHKLMLPTGSGFFATNFVVADNTWTHVTFKSSLSGALCKNSISMDGMIAQISSFANSQSSFSPLSIQVGMTEFASASWEFDNVIIQTM